MKLTLLFLMLPFLALSTTSPASKKLIKPESLQLGVHLKNFGVFLNNKTEKVSNTVTSYHLKVNIFNIGTAKMEDAFVLSEMGIIKSLSLVFNKANGVKFRNDIIEKYGMPEAEMADNYQWKSQNVSFEIHETATGFTATYQNIHPEPLIAKF